MSQAVVSSSEDQLELVDERSTKRMKLQEAVTFVRRGMDGQEIELLTGICWEDAWEAAVNRRARVVVFLPTPAEIVERAREVRLARPGVKGEFARFQEPEWYERGDEWR